MDVQPPAFTQFNSPDEFRARPFYRDDVTPPGVKPTRILGSYRFGEPVRCGLKGCTQTHEHGYLVLIADGTETNTGWDCGLDHFGFEFLDMRQHYDRVEREYPRRAALRRMLEGGEHLREMIQSLQLRPYGGNWLLRNLRHFEKLYPEGVLEVVRRLAEQGEVEVDRASIYADAEPGAVDAETSSEYVPEVRSPKVTVCGLKIFTLDTDNWPLFELELELNEMLQLDVEQMPYGDIAQWSQWAEMLESRLADLGTVIDEGKTFFRRSNLELLRYLAPDSKSRELLSWIVFSSDFTDHGDKQAAKKKFWQRKLERLIIALNQ